MPDNINDKKDKMLPPRPGEKPVKKEIKGMPFAFYVNGNLIETNRQEAIGVMVQILNILAYQDQVENVE